mmetsp:Transcript_20055/g.65346  ORF Transcript_20055/g.65346 Transcript_20055/m.65346 type:complete len:445 (+) Transcript_20055:456-1790(+)
MGLEAQAHVARRKLSRGDAAQPGGVRLDGVLPALPARLSRDARQESAQQGLRLPNGTHLLGEARGVEGGGGADHVRGPHLREQQTGRHGDRAILARTRALVFHCIETLAWMKCLTCTCGARSRARDTKKKKRERQSLGGWRVRWLWQRWLGFVCLFGFPYGCFTASGLGCSCFCPCRPSLWRRAPWLRRLRRQRLRTSSPSSFWREPPPCASAAPPRRAPPRPPPPPRRPLRSPRRSQPPLSPPPRPPRAPPSVGASPRSCSRPAALRRCSPHPLCRRRPRPPKRRWCPWTGRPSLPASPRAPPFPSSFAPSLRASFASPERARAPWAPAPVAPRAQPPPPRLRRRTALPDPPPRHPHPHPPLRPPPPPPLPLAPPHRQPQLAQPNPPSQELRHRRHRLPSQLEVLPGRRPRQTRRPIRSPPSCRRSPRPASPTAPHRREPSPS